MSPLTQSAPLDTSVIAVSPEPAPPAHSVVCLSGIGLLSRYALDQEAAAQAAAYFTARAGATIDRKRLLTLLYLADREALRRYGDTISCDYLLNLPDGPVLWHTADLFSRPGPLAAPWCEWMSPTADGRVSLSRDVSRDSLDYLSEVNLESLDAVWREAGHLDSSELRRYVDRHCPEYQATPAGQLQISEPLLLRELGFSLEESRWILDRLETHRRMNEFFTAPCRAERPSRL